MNLKQTYQNSQPKAVKDFFISPEKSKSKSKNLESDNFFTKLIKHAHNA